MTPRLIARATPLRELPPPLLSRSGERTTVERPDGSLWHSDPRWSPQVFVDRQHGPNPIILVCRTDDLELAARMASVRWPAFYPDLEQPRGELEWRTKGYTGRPYSGQRGDSGKSEVMRPSDGTGSRSFPVVVLAPPAGYSRPEGPAPIERVLSRGGRR